MTPSVTCSDKHQALEAGLSAWRRLSEARGPVLRRGSVLQAVRQRKGLCHMKTENI